MPIHLTRSGSVNPIEQEIQVGDTRSASQYVRTHFPFVLRAHESARLGSRVLILNDIGQSERGALGMGAAPVSGHSRVGRALPDRHPLAQRRRHGPVGPDRPSPTLRPTTLVISGAADSQTLARCRSACASGATTCAHICRHDGAQPDSRGQGSRPDVTLSCRSASSTFLSVTTGDSP